jgi:hypothetical protein
VIESGRRQQPESRNLPRELETSHPQLLKPRRVGSGVANGVLNVAVPEIVLNQPCVCALIRESKAAGIAQHVGMDGNRQLGLLAVLAQHQVDGGAVQGPPLLTEEEPQTRGLEAGSLLEPGLDGADLIPPERVRGGEADLAPGDVQQPAFDVHLLQDMPAGLRHLQPMAKCQQHETTVADFIPTALNNLREPLKFSSGEVFAVIHRFVESSPCSCPRKPLQRLGQVFRLSTKCINLSKVF